MLINVCVTAEINPDDKSKIIMKRLGKGYSHILIEYKENIYHCTGEGVHKDSLSEFLKTHKIVGSKIVELNINDCCFEWFVKGNLDKEYSEGQFVGIVFPHLEKFVKDGRQELICSEFVAWVLELMAGYKFNEELDFIDPVECFEFIVA